MIQNYHDNGLLIHAGMTSFLAGAGRSLNWILGNSSQHAYLARWLLIPLVTWEVRPKQKFIGVGFWWNWN
jgi:hypothetical protein